MKEYIRRNIMEFLDMDYFFKRNEDYKDNYDRCTCFSDSYCAEITIVRKKMDKSGLNKGPWSNEKDVFLWQSELSPTLVCLILRQNRFFNLSGYVLLTKAQYDLVYDMSWSFKCDKRRMTFIGELNFRNQEDGIFDARYAKRPSIRDRIHNIYGLGFDCNTKDDALPIKSEKINFEKYRDFDYVKNECENLAHQINLVLTARGFPI